MIEDFSYGIIPIYKEEGEPQFLLIKHSAGHWAFPKGHKEDGESEIDTAKRETYEETGLENLQLVVNHHFEEQYFFHQHGKLLHKTVKYFPAFTKQKDIRIDNDEIVDARWVNFDQAISLATFKQLEKIIRDVQAWLG